MTALHSVDAAEKWLRANALEFGAVVGVLIDGGLDFEGMGSEEKKTLQYTDARFRK